jgi:hypothetical protein
MTTSDKEEKYPLIPKIHCCHQTKTDGHTKHDRPQIVIKTDEPVSPNAS